MTAVSNSSPLIGLSGIGSLDLLHKLFGAIHIPQAVYDEVVVKGRGRPGAHEVDGAHWIIRHAVADKQAVSELRDKSGLEQGESEAIMLALELNATLIILVDRSARRRAKELQLCVNGTLGVLVLAKEKHLLTSVKQHMDALRLTGIYISPAVYDDVLQGAGES